MYLCQDILQYCVMPVLEPEELVSLSMASRLFREIVNSQVSKDVIRRVNNLLGRFFGDYVIKVKQFMSDSGIFLSKDDILQCIINEDWSSKVKWSVDNIHFYCKLVDKCNMYNSFIKMVANWGFNLMIPHPDNYCLFMKEDKHVYMYFMKENEIWLNSFRSRYYVQNNIDKLKIDPSYGSVIKRTVKYDANIRQLNIFDTLNELKNRGFKIDISLDKLCCMFKNFKLFEVSFIDCTYMDNGVKRYNYEYKNGNKWFLEHNCNDQAMCITGNVISFQEYYTISRHSIQYSCPLDIYDSSVIHFHYVVYIKEEKKKYDCIFIVV